MTPPGERNGHSRTEQADLFTFPLHESRSASPVHQVFQSDGVSVPKGTNTSAPPACDKRFADVQIHHAVANDGDAFMLSRQFVQLGGDAFGPLLGVPI